MIKYAELVEYTKRNHVNWSTDLFDVLKGFFEKYSSHDYSQPPPQPSYPPIKQELIMPKDFKEPENGEYTAEDLMNLLNT